MRQRLDKTRNNIPISVARYVFGRCREFLEHLLIGIRIKRQSSNSLASKPSSKYVPSDTTLAQNISVDSFRSCFVVSDRPEAQ